MGEPKIGWEEYIKQYRKIHKKEFAEKKKIRYHNDEEYRKKVIDVARKIKKNLLEKRKAEIFELLGNKCANPYNLEHGNFLSDPRCLQIDHKNGHGKKDIGLRCRTTYYRDVLQQLKAGSKNYQLLCANCNWIKKRENGEL